MNVHLLFPDTDVDPNPDASDDLPWNADDVEVDLGVEPLVQAMSRGDTVFAGVARRATLSPLTDPDVIEYRQQVLQDCLEHRESVRVIYEIAVRVVESETRGLWGFIRYHPSSIAYETRKLLQSLVASLRELRKLSDRLTPVFSSAGFHGLFHELSTELNDVYLDSLDALLDEARFARGVLISARFGRGNAPTDHTLRRPRADERGFLVRLFGNREKNVGFEIDPHDDAGSRALSELKDRGMNVTAEALQQSVDHIQRYFTTLRSELAFFLGAANLADVLTSLDLPICFPRLERSSAYGCEIQGLYDPALAVVQEAAPVRNDLDLADADLVVITGANRGGKSTLLRSVGLAQLMAQCGMFVAAESARTGIRAAIATHFAREEDDKLRSGRLDAELERMRIIVDRLPESALLLMNESFSSTNEREGSQIALQVIRTLRERGMFQCAVTHLYDLASTLCGESDARVRFLRAERLGDGTRTFRVIPGEPRATAYGRDLYERVFGTGPSRRTTEM